MRYWILFVAFCAFAWWWGVHVGVGQQLTDAPLAVPPGLATPQPMPTRLVAPTPAEQPA